MPSSDPTTIPHVLRIVSALSPRSILDVGAGNGRYGFLFREILDLNYGRFNRADWRVRIDAVEVSFDYLTEVHNWAYNSVAIGDWLDIDPFIHYDLVFMGDVLEHFPEGDWQEALSKARNTGKHVIVVAPNWPGSIAQGEWRGHKHEEHRVELSPAMVGGRCLFANSKCFIAGFGGGILDDRDILL